MVVADPGVAWAPALVLAHQGGWDETLLVLAPVVVVAALLHRANRRAKQHLADRAASDDAGPGDGGGSEG